MEKPSEALSLVNQTLSDAVKLAGLEMDLFRAELKDAARRVQRLALLGALAAACLVPAIFFLCLGLGEWVTVSSSLSLWQSHFLLFGLTSLVGGGFLLKLRKDLEETVRR